MLIERCFDAILADGLAFHQAQPALLRAGGKAKARGRQPRRVGHNLLLRLSVRKPDVLRFLTDPRVPFTNNLAERDGRMMKLRQKIFGGFGSDRAGVDPAERVAAGDLGRRGTIRPQSTPAAFPTRRSEPPAGGGVAADHERDTVSKTFQSLS